MIFGSDNQPGASGQILDTINLANTDFSHGYGDDDWTKQAIAALKKIFECDLEVYFVTTGTAANSLALSCMVQPWDTILCHHQAHILQDESTAPEHFTGGARMRPVTKTVGKITTDHLERDFKNALNETPHNSIATALSITQVNELGLVYTPDEIAALCTIAKTEGLRIHMDGARFANALASLKCTPAELSWKSGVDVLTLGATKCGALCAEAVIFFDKALTQNFEQRRKRTGHLVSKGHFFGAQFVGWLKDNHWLELANHANSKAVQLAEMISPFEKIQLIWPVQANVLFITLPRDLASYLQKAGVEFHEWYQESLSPNTKLRDSDVIVRMVTSFATQERHLTEFCELTHKYYSDQ
jgi:threonine aldolase